MQIANYCIFFLRGAFIWSLHLSLTDVFPHGSLQILDIILKQSPTPRGPCAIARHSITKPCLFSPIRLQLKARNLYPVTSIFHLPCCEYGVKIRDGSHTETFQAPYLKTLHFQPPEGRLCHDSVACPSQHPLLKYIFKQRG